MAKYLANPAAHNWPLRADELLVRCGFPDGRVPSEGFPTTMIDGVEVWAVPRTTRFTIRVQARCPECGKVVAAGRLDQHVRKSRSHNPGR